MFKKKFLRIIALGIAFISQAVMSQDGNAMNGEDMSIEGICSKKQQEWYENLPTSSKRDWVYISEGFSFAEFMAFRNAVQARALCMVYDSVVGERSKRNSTVNRGTMRDIGAICDDTLLCDENRIYDFYELVELEMWRSALFDIEYHYKYAKKNKRQIKSLLNRRDREKLFEGLSLDELPELLKQVLRNSSGSLLSSLDSTLLLLAPLPHPTKTITHESNEFLFSFSSNKRKIKFINSSNESFESSDSDTTESKCFVRYGKKIIDQENSETSSNQDTNGTTGPKKENLKSATSIGLSTLSIESSSPNLQERFNDTKELNVHKLLSSSFKFTSEDFEFLFDNDGTCNNAPNTEVSKEESNDELNLFLIYNSRTYHTYEFKKEFTNKRPPQKKIELEDNI